MADTLTLDLILAGLTFVLSVGIAIAVDVYQLKAKLANIIRFIGQGLCCTNPVRDSSHESSTVAGLHEQTRIPDIQNPELAGLQ